MGIRGLTVLLTLAFLSAPASAIGAGLERAVQVAQLRTELAELENARRPFDLQMWSLMPQRPRLGDPVSIGMRASRNSYLTLFLVDASGQPQVLMENQFVNAHAHAQFPSVRGHSRFIFSAPAGLESFVLVGSDHPLTLPFARQSTGGAIAKFAMSYAEFVDELDDVLDDLRLQSWMLTVLNLQVAK